MVRNLFTCPSDQGGRHLSYPQLGSTIRYEGDVGQGVGGEHRGLGRRSSCIVLKVPSVNQPTLFGNGEGGGEEQIR